MTIKEAIARHLAGIVPRSFWIGTKTSAGLSPYCTFKVRLTPIHRDMSGNAGLLRADVEISCLSETSPDQAQSLADIVSSSLDLKRGILSGTGGFVVQRCEMTSERDEYVEQGPGYFAIIQDFEIEF